MPPASSVDHDDDQYASSEDSDFAPEDAPAQASEGSDSDSEPAEPSSKRRRTDGEADAADDGYDNSGDEAVIQKGRKRQRRAQAKGQALADDDEDGGEGGLIKTRRQRAEEKAERKVAASKGPVTVDVDALWEQMISGKPAPPTRSDAAPADEAAEAAADEAPADTIRIKRTYNFAGRVHTEEKLVARDSAEAKLHLATTTTTTTTTTQDADGSPTKRATKKAFRSAFEPAVDAGPGRTDLDLGVAARTKAAREAQQARRLNTVEKSRMDWAGYVDKEGIQDELALAGKSKGSYNARQDFLARSEAIREGEARRARMATRT
ncbi:hypothetical protein CDD83_10767 [Cordyceps sp. RAO-2017]|nr:hypothetical protein CDD83_10767 [Cordyceps sp. RAO-2017]